MNRLLFLDCETTGLDPADSELLEVGMVVVEVPTFEIKAETHFVRHFDLKPALTKDHFKTRGGGEIFIHRKVVDMHKTNGLWEACKRSQLDDYQKMDALVRAFVLEQGCDGSVLAGANPDFDRRFLRKFLPTTERGLHYRNFDTNTFWLLQQFITGAEAVKPDCAHRAVADCKQAIAVVEQHFNFFERLLQVPG